MSRLFRPENAQKRAKEFLDVGKPSRALDVLYEVIRRGKMRNNCSEKVLEPIMFMYLRLCVELKKSHLAKEGLYQYRNIFQSVNVSTLETVVRFYLQLAEERTEAARKESHEAVTGVDDLDNLSTPEEMLLSAVSGEDAQDRSDRTILTPWVKFLWESYRQCLELLRNNSRVEKLYHEIAKKAFNFCERYQRKTEFRKLCDNLLNHLQHLQKPPTSATAVSLSNPETQQMNLETRLEQLNYAIKMELWQEAYRAIEYVSDLMNKSKKSPKPQIMASYYQKLALVFWKAGNHLFHAAALLKLFQLNKEQKKNITAEEVSKRAAVVLMATMAIPLPTAHPEFDRFIETEKSAVEKVSRLAMLLNLAKAPTRANLFKELNRCGVVAAVVPDLHNIYKLLELTFDPLNLCSTMKQKLVWVSEQPELEQYVPAVQEMTVTRLVKQLAQIYNTVTFKWLLEISVFMESFALERILVDLVRHNDLQIRVDHREGCVHFGSALSESQREDLPEGPTLQPMPSEHIRCQLIHMNHALTKCLQLIDPEGRKKEMETIRGQCIQTYNQTKAKDHSKLLQRQFTIEMRKERLENQTLEREEGIRRAQEQQQQKQKSEEQERLKREATEREKQRQEEQMKQIHTKQIKDKLAQISQTSYGQKMIEKFNEEELLSLDAEEILQRQVEELEKERKELQNRLKSQDKKVDYLERAKRLVEIPKYKELYEKQKEQDKEFWIVEEKKRVKKLTDEHQKSLEMSKRYNHMKVHLSSFLDGLKSARRSETEKKLADFNARLDVERKKRLQERKEQRRRERRDAYLREKREEEQRRLDEELKKEREEKEAEELEKQRIEEEEYMRKQEEFDRQDKMRKEKEAEIERKMREKETGAPQSQQPPQTWRGASKDIRGPREIPAREETVEGGDKPGVWKPSGGNNKWRENETEKLSVWKKNAEDEPTPADTPRKERGNMKDIRLDEDFKNEQRQRELEKGAPNRPQPAGGDDRGPPRRDLDDSSRLPRRDGGEDRFQRRDGDGRRNGDDRFPRNDDRFSRRDDDRFPRKDDDRYLPPRRDGGGGAGDRFQRNDDRAGGEDRFGGRGGSGFGGGDRDRGFGGGDRDRGFGGGGDRGSAWGDDRRGGDFRRSGASDRDFRRDGDGGGDQWRRDGDSAPRGGQGRDDRRPLRDGGGGGGGGGGDWRNRGAAEPRGQPIRRDDDRRGGGGGGERREGGDPWRRGGGDDQRGGGGGGPRGGHDGPPRREKPVAETDAEGWTKVRK